MTKYTKEQAAHKIKHYCAYQERSHKEVKDKLYSYGLYSVEVEELIAKLIEENYLNEERYAIQYAGGKLRMNHWGKNKIKYALKSQGVSTYNITKAMQAIHDEDYIKILTKLTRDKWSSLKSDQYIIRQAKTKNYLFQKGFETELINTTLDQIREAKDDS